jgi:hypothetical protein
MDGGDEMSTKLGVRVVAVLLVLAVAAVGLAGCKGTGQESADSSAVGTVGGVAPAAPSDTRGENLATDEAAKGAGQDAAATTDRMVIRTQTMRLLVEDTADAVSSIRDLASKHSAIVSDLQVATDTDEWLYRYDQYGYATGDGAALRGWVTVRVPSESLDAFVAEAMKLGTVKYQSEGSEDVTQQHVDLTARLANLQAEEERLRTFFDAATDVQDMLAIETELNRVRAEIESLDAQVKYLERQAAMATVTIELTEDKPIVRPEGESWGFKDAITSGFRGAAAVINFAVAFAIATAPLWVIALIAFFIIRAIVRRRRTSRVEQPAETQE